MPDVNGDDDAAWPNGAWIELINHDDEAVDLDGWGFVAPAAAP